MSDRAWLLAIIATFVALSLAGYRATYQCVGTSATCAAVFVAPDGGR